MDSTENSDLLRNEIIELWTRADGYICAPVDTRKALGYAVKLLVTVALVGFLAWITPIHETVKLLSHAHLEWLALSLCGLMLGAVFQAQRWLYLLDHPDVRLSQLLHIHLVGTAAGFFLPSAVAGDIVRSGMLAREGNLLERSILSTVVGRLMGLTAMMCLGIGGALLWPNPALRFQPSKVALLLIGAGIVGIGPLWMLWKKLRRNREWWMQGASWKKRIYEGFTYLESLRNPVLLLKCFALSLGLQGVTLLSGWCLFHAVEADLSLAAAFALIPVAQLGSLAPLSLGGVGVREGVTMALFHGLVGIPRAQCLAASALGYLNGFAISLPGVFLILLTRRKKS